MIANIAFLYIAFIVLIISQLVLGFKFAVRRFSGLIGYIAWFTFYLLFVSTAYFRDLSSSTMPLGCK